MVVRDKNILIRTVLPFALFMLLACPAGADPIKVDGGLIEGTHEGTLTVYKGIPFAAPPVGELRWRAPQPVVSWNGVKHADTFAPECMQDGVGDPRRWNPEALAPSEDCLYLNVWTPARGSTERLPVMVWIYPGGFQWGASSDRLTSGEQLANKGVIVVSIAYRLGPFGFLAHPALSAESEKHVSGNYGLLDMIASLQWVQKNIAAFGGDSGRVTIFGESAGAIAVSMLAASPLAKGLFQGAIAESGASFGPIHGGDRGPGENMHTLAEAEKTGAAWADKAGASTVQELRAIPADKLESMKSSQGAPVWPIVDGWVIPDDQYKLYQEGHYNDVPILVGYNSDEGASFSPPRTTGAYVESVRKRYGLFEEDLLEQYHPGDGAIAKSARDLTRDAAFGWHMWTWARLQSETGKSKAYLYYFDHHPDNPADSGLGGSGAPHGSEVPYVFEHLGGDRLPPATPDNLAISGTMATYWTNFAKTGDPNGQGMTNWPAFTDKSSAVMYFTATTYVGSPDHQAGLKVLDEYFAWRRAGDPATGIAQKMPVFGGACKVCPWGAIGQAVKRSMQPYGYEVQMCYNCNQMAAPLLVSQASLPPPYKYDVVVGSALAPPNADGLGPVDFGATTAGFLAQAYDGRGAYAKNGGLKNLRLIANIQSPDYLLVAINRKSGITDLSLVKQQRWPLHVYLAGAGVNAADAILQYYGLSRASIEAAGGYVGNTDEEMSNFDIAIGGGVGMATVPEFRAWPKIVQNFDVRFVQLPDDLLVKLSKDTGQEIGLIPFALYPGINYPIRTVVGTGTVIYCRADAPDDFAYDVAKAIDEQQDQLQWSNQDFSYNIHNVWKAEDVPLHPGAERYYKEKGYMK